MLLVAMFLVMSALFARQFAHVLAVLPLTIGTPQTQQRMCTCCCCCCLRPVDVAMVVVVVVSREVIMVHSTATVDSSGE